MNLDIDGVLICNAIIKYCFDISHHQKRNEEKPMDI